MMFGLVDSSLSEDDTSDLESDSWSQWLFWIVESFSVNVPSLLSICFVTFVPLKMISVSVGTNMEASFTDISDCSSRSSVPSHLLKHFTFVLSDNSSVAVIMPVSTIELNRDDSSSIGSISDSSSSPVEDEPLFVVVWVEVLNSQSVLMGSNMFSNENSSVSGLS